MRSAASVADQAGFFLLTACGVLAPIANGSNTASAAALVGAALAVCVLLSPYTPPLAERSRALHGKVLLWSGLMLAWALVQTLAPDAGTVPALLEAARPEATIRTARFNLQPLQSAGYVLIPFAAFMSALVYIRSDARYLTFLHILLGAGFVVTSACIAEYTLSPQTLLLRPKMHYLESFTGTFVNPNTAATYYGTMLMLSLSLCLRQFDQVRRHQRMIRVAPGNPILRKLLIYCLWAIVFAIALLLTRSRAGTLASFTAVLGFIAAYAVATMKRRGSPVRFVSVGTFVAVGAVVLLFAVFAQRVALRVQTEGFLDTGRLCTYESTLQAIREHPWLGTGLGSFQDVFPAYRSPECGLNGYWEMAHSVYLEAWLTLGVFFFVALAIIYHQLLKTYIYGYRHRHRFRFVPLASLGILVLLSLHSLVDFSLQIPGMAVVAALALGAGAAVSLARTIEAEPEPADAAE